MATDKYITPGRASGLTDPLDRPNVQGKGQVGFLLDWAYSSPRGVVAKPGPQLLADYFTSLLVLSAAFKFKPAYGTEYVLYLEDDGWALSLIGPEEWNDDAKSEACVGKCVLHDDSTWSIEPSENIGSNDELDDALAAFYDGFIDKLSSDTMLEDDLPFYQGKLPYYQRLFASALSRSMQGSMILGGQLGRSSGEWLERLPQEAGQLLLGSGSES